MLVLFIKCGPQFCSPQFTHWSVVEIVNFFSPQITCTLACKSAVHILPMPCLWWDSHCKSLPGLIDESGTMLSFTMIHLQLLEKKPVRF